MQYKYLVCGSIPPQGLCQRWQRSVLKMSLVIHSVTTWGKETGWWTSSPTDCWQKVVLWDRYATGRFVISAVLYAAMCHLHLMRKTTAGFCSLHLPGITGKSTSGQPTANTSAKSFIVDLGNSSVAKYSIYHNINNGNNTQFSCYWVEIHLVFCCFVISVWTADVVYISVDAALELLELVSMQ